MDESRSGTTSGQMHTTEGVWSRRGFIASGGLLVAALAGCTGGDGGDQEPETGTTTTATTATPTTTTSPPTTTTTTTTRETLVEVGPGGNFTFTPGTDEPVRVGAGAAVRFVWRSGGHNIVVGSQPPAASWTGHEPIESAGFETTHTFEEPGEYEFWCGPHKGLGMVGLLVVE